MKRVKTEASSCEPETKITKLQALAKTQVENFEHNRLKEVMTITMSLFQKNIGVSMTQREFKEKLEGYVEIKKRHSCSKCAAGRCTNSDLCKMLIYMHDSDVERNMNQTERLERNPFKELYNRWTALSPTVLEQKQCFQLLCDSGFLQKQANYKQGQQKWTWLHLEKDSTFIGQFEW